MNTEIDVRMRSKKVMVSIGICARIEGERGEGIEERPVEIEEIFVRIEEKEDGEIEEKGEKITEMTIVKKQLGILGIIEECVPGLAICLKSKGI